MVGGEATSLGGEMVGGNVFFWWQVFKHMGWGVGMPLRNFLLNHKRRPIWGWIKLFCDPLKFINNIIKFLYFFTCNKTLRAY